jgi:hypothetical protein
MIDLIRAGRDDAESAREFEPSVQAIRNQVGEADRRDGRGKPKILPVRVSRKAGGGLSAFRRWSLR